MAERYKRLFYDVTELHTINSPVSILARALLWDNEYKRTIAQIKCKNIFGDEISSVSVLIKTYDTAREFKEDIPYEYMDLSAGQFDEFGDQTPIDVKETAVRYFDVYVSRVVFSDGKVWKAQRLENYELDKTIFLAEKINDNTLLMQYKHQYGNGAIIVPRTYEDIWFCVCGNANYSESMVCSKCGQSKDEMIKDLDIMYELHRENQYKKAMELYQNGSERLTIKSQVKK